MKKTMACSLMVLTAAFAGKLALAESTRGSLESKVFIAPILELSISENAQSELKFGNIASSGLAPTQTHPKGITIIVKSNSGAPYLVTQTISGPLENSEGQTIGLENLKFRSVAEKSTGTAVSELIAVAPSAQTIFTSSQEGIGETILAEYQLTIPPSQPPGDYSALITYTVSSI
jgi:hypothetical protein